MHRLMVFNHLFGVHYENSTSTVDYGTGSIVCHLFFSSYYDAGYFNMLQNDSHTLKQYNVKKYKRERSLTVRKERTVGK